MTSAKWTDAAWERLRLPGDPPPRDTDGANRAVVADLLEAIEHNRPPQASGEEARWTLEMVMAIYESHRAGGRVPLPLKRREHPLS
jgi:predicted dehydrogenase